MARDAGTENSPRAVTGAQSQEAAVTSGKATPWAFCLDKHGRVQAGVAVALGPGQGARRPPWGQRVLRSGPSFSGRRSQLQAWCAR